MALTARRHPTESSRWVAATRLLVLTGAVVGAVGVAGRFLSWPLLTSTVGPTAYVFAAHPASDAARVRNAWVGHAVAVAAGLAALAAFGLLHRPSVSASGAPSLRQAAAAACAAGITVAVLQLAGSHHAPAAATALLIATGLAKPGAPLIGLVLGLAVVLVCAPLLTRLPLGRAAVAEGDRSTGGGSR